MTQDETHDPNTLYGDIAYIKALAQAGFSAPLQNGMILVAAGLIFGTASVVHWSIINKLVGLGPTAIAIAWLASAVVFGLVMFFQIRSIHQNPMAQNHTNQASGSVWTAAGYGIFTLFVVLILAGARLNMTEVLMNLIAPGVMLFYGIAWSSSAMICRKGWMHGVAMGCFAMAALLGWFIQDPNQMLVYAAALILLATVPGLILMRAARGEVA